MCAYNAEQRYRTNSLRKTSHLGQAFELLNGRSSVAATVIEFTVLEYVYDLIAGVTL